MTLEQLLNWARTYGRLSSFEKEEVAQGLMDMLGEALPCGFPTPAILRAPGKETMVDVEPGDGSGVGSCFIGVGEARAWAAAILHACDRAEER